jgi:hypothetical protein
MSQRSKILSHLKRHKTITPIQALHDFGCLRLAARIQELRESHTILTERASNGRHAVYKLVK